MMVKIAVSLAHNEALGLPLQPLVWALGYGTCLGGMLKLLWICLFFLNPFCNLI